MLYQNLRKGLNSKARLVPYDQDIRELIDDQSSDYYVSLFQYTDTHKQYLSEKGSLAGIRDTTTNKFYLDFDSVTDLDEARKDAVRVAQFLVEANGIPVESIGAYFSGKKGFSLEMTITERINSEQVISILSFLSAQGLTTLDKQVSDPNRIVRVPNTKHQSTGLYKIPLELYELDEMSIADIKSLAVKPRLDFDQNRVTISLSKTSLAPYLTAAPKERVIGKKTSSTDLDYSIKPKNLTNCRWALQNGMFAEGIRHQALLCLASTYKNMGYNVEMVYRMLKGVAQMQANHTETERYPDEELYNNVVVSVFGDTWQNGQFTCKKEGWLKDYCEALGGNCCKKNTAKSSEPHTLDDVTESFKEYTKNIDQNTIRTGIQGLDDLVFITTGSSVGLVGSPGSGKTSIVLSILNNTSKAGIKSVFASLDMHRNRMYEKVMYHVSGYKREQLYEIFKNNEETELREKLKQEFGNVFFFNKSCPTVSDVRDYILDCEKESGEKIKLVVLDYFERVSSDFSDETQASKRVAGELQDLVNDLDVALITIVQPNKNALSGGVDSPIYDYTKIKGSSFLYQSFRQIVSLWRPGYSPKNFHNDKYLQMAVLKNDLGELGECAFNWHGPTGKITEMEPHQESEFEKFLQWKDNQKNPKKDDGNGWD